MNTIASTKTVCPKCGRLLVLSSSGKEAGSYMCLNDVLGNTGHVPPGWRPEK